MKKVFVFDLDDTLMTNVHDYAQSILDMARIIIEQLGAKAPHVSAVIALEEEIDKRRVHEINPITGHKFLYSMERFPRTMVQTYREICQRVRVEPDKLVEKELYKIGMQAFDPARYKGNIFPEAIPTIYFLDSQGDTPMLLSKGDQRVQSKKFSAISAGNNFFRARIVDDKTPQVFKEMKRGYENDVFYSVGNDYEKDIVPALEAGYKGILIPAETWEVIGRTDQILAKVDRSKCFVFNCLGELKERYGEL